MVSRSRHVAVVIAVKFIDADIRMTRELHHSPHIQVLFVSSEQLLLGVARDYYIWWSIFSDMKQRSVLIYIWSELPIPLLLRSEK